MCAHKTEGAVVLGSDFKALGVVRSLGQRGIPCVVVDNNPRAAWFSRYVVKRFRLSAPMDDAHVLSFLSNVATTHNLQQWVLLPTQDEFVQLVACNVPRLSKSYRLATQDWTVIRWAHDKRLTYKMAEEAGVPYPRTLYVTQKEELTTLNVDFPVIIKPAISVHLQYAAGCKALPASSVQELLMQYDTAVACISPDEVMVQEIIPGDGRVQYSIATFCEEGHIKQWMTARRKRQYPIDYGLASSFVQAEDVPALLPLAEKLVSYMRVSGMVELEFKYDERDHQYKLLDINVRPWGWHTLCIACGLDLPYLQYCSAVGKPLALRTTIDYDRQWVRVLTDIPAGIQEIRTGITTPLAYLRSFRGKTAFSVFNWRDPLPVFADVVIAAARVIRDNRKVSAKYGRLPVKQPRNIGQGVPFG